MKIHSALTKRSSAGPGTRLETIHPAKIFVDDRKKTCGIKFVNLSTKEKNEYDIVQYISGGTGSAKIN
jgi:hypothetical protein